MLRKILITLFNPIKQDLKEIKHEEVIILNKVSDKDKLRVHHSIDAPIENDTGRRLSMGELYINIKKELSN